MPSLRGAWRYDAAAKQVRIDVAQTQKGDAYRLPLEIGIVSAAGQPRIERDRADGSATGTFAVAADDRAGVGDARSEYVGTAAGGGVREALKRRR